MAWAKASSRVLCGVVVCAALIVGTWVVATAVHDDARTAELEGLKSAALATMVGARTATDAHVQSMLTLAEGFVARPNHTHPMPVASFQNLARRFSLFGGTEPRVTSMSVSVPVPPSERAAFEAAIGATIRGFPPPRESVAPGPLGYFTSIVLLYPLRLYDTVYGVDVHDAQVSRGLAVDRCIQEGVVVATGLVYPANNLQRPGATFHAPIRYDDREGRSGVLGMFVERELFAATFRGHGLPAFVELMDVTDPEHPDELYTEAPPDTSAHLELASLEYEVATRRWRARMLTTSDVLEARTDAVAIDEAVYIVGVSLAVLLGFTTFAALEARHRAQAARLANVAGAVAEAAHVRLLKFLNHELRNPLAVVIACVDQMLASPSWPLGEDLLGSAADAAVARQDMRVVLDAAQKMALVLEDASEVKRMGDSRTKPKPEHTDIVAMLRDTANQLSPFVEDGSGFIVRSHPGVPRTVMVDGRLLRHIVTAAVANAMEYSTGDRIELRARALTASGRTVGSDGGTQDVGAAYVLVEVLNVGRGLQGKDEADLMGMELVTATVPVEVRRAAARPVLESATQGSAQALSAEALAMIGGGVAAATSSNTQTSFSTGGSTVDEAAGGVTMIVSGGASNSGSSATGYRSGYAGLGGTMNLAMCYRLAVAMGGAAGIADVPAASVARAAVISPTRAAARVTRFWVVVEAPPATAPVEPDLLAAVVAHAHQAELARRSDSDADESSSTGGAKHGVTFNACNGAVSSSLSPAHSVGAVAGPHANGAGAGPTLPTSHAKRQGPLPASGAPENGSGKAEPMEAKQQPPQDADAGLGAPSVPACAANGVPAPVITSRRGSQRGSRDGRASSTRRAQRAASKRAADAIAAPDLPGGAIVVDDERMFRRAVTRYLKSMGAAVAASLEDGDELQPTLELLETPPSVVLLDIVMRRSVGVDVLRALRLDARWASLPVYAMTSNVERVEEYRAAGFNGLLGKPFSKAKLAAALHHAVNEEVRQSKPFLDATKL